MLKILFFLPFLLIILFPRPASATSCCRSPALYLPTQFGASYCCSPDGIQCDNSYYQCGNFTCDPSTSQCTQTVQPTATPVYTCTGGTAGVQSAIGCIQTGDLKEFLAFLMRFVIGISAAIILIMLVITGYNVLTSAGNPEKLAASKENLVALISGLILIIFSLVLLQVIGVDILKLPGFTP